MKDPSKAGLPPGGGVKLFAAVSFAALGVGTLIYVGLRTAGVVNNNGGSGVNIAAVIFSLLFLALAYGATRMVFPPKARHVTLHVDRTEVTRGEDVVVHVDVGARASDRLELGLVCAEFFDQRSDDGKGNTTRSTVQATAFEDWHPLSGGSGQTLSLAVPEEAPYSYRGDCISYVWRVSAREPRRLRFDPAINVHLLVRP
jgi:hypothetical protein